MKRDVRSLQDASPCPDKKFSFFADDFSKITQSPVLHCQSPREISGGRSSKRRSQGFFQKRQLLFSGRALPDF
jgi:hypothetical protein